MNNHFMLDSNKSDVMFVGSPILLAKSNLPTKVAFDGNSFSLLFELKILNVTFDSSFNFTHLTQASSFHLHAIKQVPFNTAVTWTISLVLSRLDYCKSFLFWLLSCLIFELQSFQNRTAKTVLQAGSSSRACLDRLH